MSSLARKLAATPPSTPVQRVRPGPQPVCRVYGTGDLEDWEAIQEFRNRPTESWRTTQRHWDGLLGITQPILNDKFRYHWKRRCSCWPDDLRLQ